MNRHLFIKLFKKQLNELSKKERSSRRIKDWKKRSSDKMNEFMQFFNSSSPENVSTSVKLILLLTVLSISS